MSIHIESKDELALRRPKIRSGELRKTGDYYRFQAGKYVEVLAAKDALRIFGDKALADLAAGVSTKSEPKPEPKAQPKPEVVQTEKREEEVSSHESKKPGRPPKKSKKGGSN